MPPPTDLRDHLARALGNQYRIERELGGGGMARVFVTEELALGRRVVVKVLDREMAQGLSAERFALEAQLAAVSGVDSRQRLASLDSMLALGPIGVRVVAAGNLVLSRLWERADSVQRAYQVVQRGDGSELYAPVLREQGGSAPASATLRARSRRTAGTCGCARTPSRCSLRRSRRCGRRSKNWRKRAVAGDGVADRPLLAAFSKETNPHNLISLL